MTDYTVIRPEEKTGAEMYRLINSCVVPRPVAWVSSQDTHGVLNLAPFSHFTMVSSDPMAIAFSSTRRWKDSSTNAKETGEFVVNIGDMSTVEALNNSAQQVPPEVSEFELVGVTPAPSVVVKPPRVAEAPISLECKTFQIVEIGNSPLVVGEIVAIHVRSDLLNDKGMVRPDFHMVGKLAGPLWVKNGGSFTLDRVDM